MVRTSGIRQKLRSKVLEELARERSTSTKRAKLDTTQRNGKDESSADESEDEEEARPRASAAASNSSLLSMLPRPKQSFGPSIRIDKLLRMPERAEKPEPVPEPEAHRFQSTYSSAASAILDTKASVVVVPKGKEKQKNQITYLAQLGKAKELEHKELAAQSRLNKAATRSKYGW